jgi:hypothetical protein
VAFQLKPFFSRGFRNRETRAWIGVSLSALACALVFTVAGWERSSSGGTDLRFFFPLAALVGGIIAGSFTAVLFGRMGAKGWLRAALGAFLSTLLGSAITGTFLIPVIGTIFGPPILFALFFVEPALGALWVACFVVTHLVARSAAE